MEAKNCVTCESGRAWIHLPTWDAGTARIVWYCVTLLFAMAAIATLAPFLLSPRGAEGIYWIVRALVDGAPDGAAIANAGQALASGEGLWAVPASLWASIALYIVADAALAFSTWIGLDMGWLGKGLSRVRPAMRWIAAVAMVVLLVAGASEHLLREGYVQHPDLWLQEDGSALPGLTFLLASALLVPIVVAVTARLGIRLPKVIARFERRSASAHRVVCCCRAVCNGVAGWILLTVTLVAGLVVLPVLLVVVTCAAAFAIGLLLTIMIVPFALRLAFLHILCDRDI